MSLNPLEKRIIELSYRHKLTHVSSCLNCVNVLSWIYDNRDRDDPVCLCNGHAGLALYVCLEANGLCYAEEMIKKHGVHPSRDMQNGIWCSTGSLGQGETIATGMALADHYRKVWLVTSDGGMAEGSVWEAFAFASEQKLTNLKIHIVINGYGAYREIDKHYLWDRCAQTLRGLDWTRHVPEMPFSWLEGLDGHYLQISDAQYAEAMS